MRIDPFGGEAPFATYGSIDEALQGASFDVLVDFTQPSVFAKTLEKALPAGVDCVVGTTGMSDDTLNALAASAKPGTCLFYAPNFTTGAVLMMEFAKAVALISPNRRLSNSIIAIRKDAPSGTAVRTRPDNLPAREILLVRLLAVKPRLMDAKAHAEHWCKASRCILYVQWGTLRVKR